jgi:hypothetical protein
MRIKRKRSIEILGVKHKIKHVNTGDKGGFYSASDKEIEVDKDLNNEEQYMDTILHESFHGVFQITGIHQDISLAQEHVITDSIISFLRANFTIEWKK